MRSRSPAGRRPDRRAVAVTAAAAVVLVVAGCGSAGEEVAEGLTGADEIDLDDGGFTIEDDGGSATFQPDGDDGGTITFENDDGDAGSVTIGTGELPDGFPAALPLPPSDGITSATSFVQDGQTVQSVTFAAPGLDAAAADAYCDQLAAAGFELQARSTTAEFTSCSGQDAAHLVTALLLHGPEGAAQLTVSPAQG